MGNCFTKEYDIPITSAPRPPTMPRPPASPPLPPPPPQPLPSTKEPPVPVPKPNVPVQEQQSPPQLPERSSSIPIQRMPLTLPPKPARIHSASPSAPLVGPVLQKPMSDVTSHFTLERELGRGYFGVTYLCRERGTGARYACKSVSKRKLVRRGDIEDMRREVAILKHLSGQPNVVEFKGAFEDEDSVHLVMEFCSGGELFDRITAKGSYSEQKAAAVFRDIITVVHVCHFMGVIHRDLKPENFLLASKDEDAEIKAIDFGLSVFIEEDKFYKQLVGSAYYLAPEVLMGKYGKEIDVWSAGVILYILLSGSPPFYAETEKGIFNAILVGELDLHSPPWDKISSSAKGFIRRMLTRDPKKRITAAQALEHPWLKESGVAPDRPIDSAVLMRMKQFTAMNKLKKLALQVIAASLKEEDIKGLREMFKNMDTDNSGTITFEELTAGLSRLGSKLSEAEVKQLMDAADIDKSGNIDYLEFTATMMNRYKLEEEKNLIAAFQHFDEDDSGYITRDELKRVMEEYRMTNGHALQEMLDEVDTDKDGRINYEEFAAMMRKKSG